MLASLLGRPCPRLLLSLCTATTSKVAGTCFNPHHPSSTHSMLPSRASLTALDGRGTHAGRVTPEQLRLQATDWICRAL